MATPQPQWDDRGYMKLALEESRKSPPKPTNFSVGACLVAKSTSYSNQSQSQNQGQVESSRLLTTGYTLECSGNTHAEQSCFLKFARLHDCDEEEDIGHHLPEHTVLYTTMEPCNKRSVGNLPCVDRILRLRREDGRQAVEKVYIGIEEPGTFVGVNEGRRRLEEARIRVIHVPGFEEEIMGVATAGHEKVDDGGGSKRENG